MVWPTIPQFILCLTDYFDFLIIWIQKYELRLVFLKIILIFHQFAQKYKANL